jgi:hypothetical protein
MHQPSTPARRPPLFVRLFTAPVTPGAVERRLQRQLAPMLAWAWFAALAVLLALLAWAGWAWWASRVPTLTARHRAEALCFELERAPRFAPPMTIEPSAAMVRGRFTNGTPATMALQDVMHYSDEMVVSQSQLRVGDYDVSVLWLRLPDGGGSHWLIVGWMEDADLAVCSFRFADTGPTLSDDELQWGGMLLRRILTDENFRAGAVPVVKLRMEPGSALPLLGPAAGR